MTLQVTTDFTAAQWLVDELDRQDWWRLVTQGPLGFEGYARLRFIPDPAYKGQSEHDVDLPEDRPNEEDLLRRAVAVLMPHTTTPDDLYFAIWEGWTPGVSALEVRKLSLPNREFILLRGESADFQTWRAPQWPDEYGRDELPAPAYIWPADQAWCLTEDVDPHVAVIGGSRVAIDALLAEPVLDLVRDDPEVEPPFYF